MANFNKVILAGNLTRDPQLSYTPSNTPVVEFGMAINRKWRGQDGNQREEACFVELQAYGRQAETLNQYMRKGQPLLVEGRLRYQQWTAQDGAKRSRHTVIVDGFQFLGGGGGGAGGGGAAAGGGARRYAGTPADQPHPADDGPPPPEDPPEGDGSGIPF